MGGPEHITASSRIISTINLRSHSEHEEWLLRVRRPTPWLAGGTYHEVAEGYRFEDLVTPGYLMESILPISPFLTRIEEGRPTPDTRNP